MRKNPHNGSPAVLALTTVAEAPQLLQSVRTPSESQELRLSLNHKT